MMRAVAYNEELVERVRAVLADRADVEEKKMFGGLTFMVAGQMCCGVLKNDLVVRIEPAEFDDSSRSRTSVRSTSAVARCRGWWVWITAAWPGLRSCGL